MLTAATGRNAVLAMRDENAVSLARIAPERLADVLVAQTAEVPAGRGRAVTVSVDDMRSTEDGRQSPAGRRHSARQPLRYADTVHGRWLNHSPPGDETRVAIAPANRRDTDRPPPRDATSAERLNNARRRFATRVTTIRPRSLGAGMVGHRQGEETNVSGYDVQIEEIRSASRAARSAAQQRGAVGEGGVLDGVRLAIVGSRSTDLLARVGARWRQAADYWHGHDGRSR